MAVTFAGVAHAGFFSIGFDRKVGSKGPVLVERVQYIEDAKVMISAPKDRDAEGTATLRMRARYLPEGPDDAPPKQVIYVFNLRTLTYRRPEEEGKPRERLFGFQDVQLRVPVSFTKAADGTWSTRFNIVVPIRAAARHDVEIYVQGGPPQRIK